MTTLIATSVVRGSNQGESHGGVYLIDFDTETVTQPIDWNTADIDWQGRGWDRGLRGIAFDGERIFIAASNELFVYNPAFELIASYRNPFLMHAHELSIYQRRLYIASTGFDSVLGFDLNSNEFCWGLNIADVGAGYQGMPFDPNSSQGPAAGNQFHINNVFCNDKGMYISGLKMGGALAYSGKTIRQWVTLPKGIHNARPYRGGVLFNDTQADKVRWVTKEQQYAFDVPQYDMAQLSHTDMDDSRIARMGFGRGLCVVAEGVIAAGSSPSTVALHDFNAMKTTKIVTLSKDIRNAIHGLEVWPF